MRTTGFRLICGGCGAEPSAEGPYPFRCVNAGEDDTDHVILRQLDLSALEFPTDDAPNPFIAFRELLFSYQWARANGLTDELFVNLVEELDRAVAEVDGRGFVRTPLARQPSLAGELGLRHLWVKDETGNVSGSHKARHLMGVAIFMALADGFRADPAGDAPPRLAIASCGNAALAAAVVARAAGRPLDVFIPPHAEQPVVARLLELGAELSRCPRQAGEQGDPCYLRFKAAIAAGAVPFTVQGSDNGLNIEGGQTLAYEMIARLAAEPVELDHLFVQVGGGALASACIAAFEEAQALGVVKRLPRIHTVQTESAYPLRRAYERVQERLANATDAAAVAAALAEIGRHRSDYMWPWESEPHSIAHGILDDETYDWLALVRGMLRTDGRALVVSEDELRAANELARQNTDIPVDPTGSSGLAGLMQMVEAGEIAPDAQVAVLFTGVDRAAAALGRDASLAGSP